MNYVWVDQFYLSFYFFGKEIVELIVRIVRETSAKTAGLGAIGEELAAEGQFELALRLAEIIREPDILANLLVTIAAEIRK